MLPNTEVTYLDTILQMPIYFKGTKEKEVQR